MTNYDQPLLNYHIKGSQDTKSLVELGLANSSGKSGRKQKISLTKLGKMLLPKSAKTQIEIPTPPNRVHKKPPTRNYR